MELFKVKVENYKSIDDSGWVNIDNVTCLVGKNESGKTTFLNALKKLNPHDGDGNFNPIIEYPRKGYSSYKRVHDKNPATVITAEFRLNENEVIQIEDEFGKGILESNEVTVSKNYANKRTWTVSIHEEVAVDYLIDNSQIGEEPIKESLYESNNLKELWDKLKGFGATNQGITQLINLLNSKFQNNYDLETYIINHYLDRFIPKFVYFDDYNIMKGEVSIPFLKQKKISNPNALDGSEKTFLALLNLAGVKLEDFESQQNYEKLKADLESASISITDEVFAFWSQNKQLEVEFDISNPDAGALPPLNQGPILHVRIKNNRHRVTVPFSERSKGFVWFFSFFAYFSEIEEANNDLILLLDEPGLSLHAKAQNDFLSFIDKRLAPKYQVLYTTHSPFMINPLNLKSVRTVEDVEDKGTIISEDILKNDKDTIFPLQAALGYDLMQTLFIGPNCLLVEGPSDYIYLQILNDLLSGNNKYEGLDDRWVITPVGGADKVSTFVSLLGANQLNTAVLVDFNEKDMQRISNLISNSLLKQGNLIKISDFVGGTAADIEDLFDPEFYIELVNGAYNIKIELDKLQFNNPRIIKKIEHYFQENDICNKHFNHYKPSAYLLRNQKDLIDKLSVGTLERASKLFEKINSLIK